MAARTIRTFTRAKLATPRCNTCAPRKTTPAASMSPERTKNVSIACFALYFSSGLVGSQSICLAVFITE